MKIDLYAVGICQNNGLPTQIAGCGTVLVFTDEENRTSLRSAGYGLGNSTQNLADIQAARVALASVIASCRGYSATLHTNSEYVNRMLERSGKSFVSMPSKNVEAVTELRRWFSYYGNIIVVVENPDELKTDNTVAVFNSGVISASTDTALLKAREHANAALFNQVSFDSGTLQDFDDDN